MGTIFSLQIKVMEKNILLTETKPCINSLRGVTRYRAYSTD